MRYRQYYCSSVICSKLVIKTLCLCVTLLSLLLTLNTFNTLACSVFIVDFQQCLDCNLPGTHIVNKKATKSL